jgi:ribonuclease Z
MVDPYWKGKKTIRIPNIETEFSLSGYSVGGLRQVFYVKEIDTLLDCGIALPFLPTKIFITHGHLDHVSALPPVCLNGEKTKIFSPKVLESRLLNFMNAGYAMSGCNTKNFEVIGLENNITFEEKLNVRNFIIQTFRCDHSIPTIGYGFIENRRKLKNEYLKFSQEDISKLINEGINVTTEKKNYTFCYLGDTTCKVFEQIDIFKYKTIICECTFFDEIDKKEAKQKKHIYWGDLVKIIEKHENIFFILIHTSQKYKFNDINEYVDGIGNCMLWKN